MIDAEALFPNKVFYVNGNDPMTSLDELINRIHNAPTIDAVEVVRCKDCNFYKQATELSTGMPRMRCENSKAIWTFTNPDDFCSYGKRK